MLQADIAIPTGGGGAVSVSRGDGIDSAISVPIAEADVFAAAGSACPVPSVHAGEHDKGGGFVERDSG